MAKTIRCKTCIHFKPNQRELNYFSSSGFCVNPKFRFNTVDGRLIGVYDKENQKDTKKVKGNPSHDIETVEFNVHESRYLLAVTEDFGCIYYENNKNE
jgi:hypothetical protein